jgi:hypothetical protein
MTNSFTSDCGRTIRVNDYVEVESRHGTKGNGTVVAIRENPAPLPDTMVLKMDEDTLYADFFKPPFEHDRERLASFGAFGGEIVRVIPKIVH